MGRWKLILALLALLSLAFRPNVMGSGPLVSAGDGGGGGGSYTVYDNYALGVHDCSDPLCADPVANGVIYADGWEDGVWFAAENATACNEGADLVANDGWDAGTQYEVFPYTGGPSSDVYGCKDYGVNGTFRWAHYRPHPSQVDTTIANYGVAGTRGVGSTGWIGDRDTSGSQGMGGSTNVAFIGSNPYSVNAGGGPDRFYFRGYFREVGSSSMMCDCHAEGGFDCSRTDSIPSPACPAAFDSDGNGLKEVTSVTSKSVDSGLGDPFSFFNRFFANGAPEIGICDGCNTTGTHVDYPSMVGDVVFNQNQGNDLTDNDQDGHWFYWEGYVDHGTTTSDGEVRLWGNDCGISGMDCGPGTSNPTPTLRAAWTGLDLQINGNAGTTRFDAFWIDFWTTAVRMERNFDALMVVDADAAARDGVTPIGFHPNVAGVTVTP